MDKAGGLGLSFVGVGQGHSFVVPKSRGHSFVQQSTTTNETQRKLEKLSEQLTQENEEKKTDEENADIEFKGITIQEDVSEFKSEDRSDYNNYPEESPVVVVDDDYLQEVKVEIVDDQGKYENEFGGITVPEMKPITIQVDPEE